MNTKDMQHLQWIYDRMVEVHKENPNYDYMIKFRDMLKDDATPTITRKGFTQAMNGRELWVNTKTDEMVKFVVKDSKARWALYCKHVKVTIEVIDETKI